MNTTEEFIKAFMELEAASKQRAVGLFKWMSEHGTAMRRVGALPRGRWKKRLGECYSNAYYMMNSPKTKFRYLYAEGYAYRKSLCVPLAHGWCVDEDTGDVIDPTWRDGDGYYGIVFRTAFVLRMAAISGHYGVIGNYHGRGADLSHGMITGDVVPYKWRHPITDEIRTKNNEGNNNHEQRHTNESGTRGAGEAGAAAIP